MADLFALMLEIMQFVRQRIRFRFVRFSRRIHDPYVTKKVVSLVIYPPCDASRIALTNELLDSRNFDHIVGYSEDG